MSLFSKILNKNDSIKEFASPQHLIGFESIDDKIRIKNQKISNKNMVKLEELENFLCSLPQLKETLQSIYEKHESEFNKAFNFFGDEDFARRIMCVQEATELLCGYLEKSQLGRTVIQDWIFFLYEYMIHSTKQFCLINHGCYTYWEGEAFVVPDDNGCFDTIEIACKVLFELGCVYYAIDGFDKEKMIEHCKKLRVSHFIEENIFKLGDDEKRVEIQRFDNNPN